jgi:plastocyanin
MKKIYTLIFLFVSVVLFTVRSSATIWQVTVNDNSFSPSTLPNVVCGDTVGWILSPTATLPHTATSTTIPAGAASFNGNVAPVYAYIVPNFAGVYNYKCAFHLFTGSFTVTCTVGIDKVDPAIAAAVYPNPFTSTVTFVNHNSDAAKIADMTGRVVKTISLNTSSDKAEINLEMLSPGIYFLITSREGVIQETKRIVKAK